MAQEGIQRSEGPAIRDEKQRGRYDLVWLSLLCLAHTVLNFGWRKANVTILGWDRAAHLVRSLEYFQAMQPFDFRELLTALMQDGFYPPLFHVSMAIAYSIFHVSADVGAMTNTVYLVILLFSVYGIGCQLYDRATGLLAACLISFFPIVFLMERFTYTEFSLLSLVALNVWVVLKTERFTRRGWTYVLGVTLGLGFLAKWVFIIFAGPPLLYVVLTSPIRQDFKSLFALGRLDRKRLLVSLVVGLTGAGIFYFFGGDWTLTTPFDSILALCYWLLLTVLTYIVLSPPGPFNNLLATLVITLVVAIIWYVPNLDFISIALYKAFYWGSRERTGAGFPVGILIRGIVNEHLSAPPALATVALVSWQLIRARNRLLALSSGAYILGLWFFVPFVIFASFSNPSSWNMRLSIGLTLPVSIILARASLSVRQVRLRTGIIIGLLTVAVFQWLVLSLDMFAPIPDYSRLNIPGWGEANWFAQGEFVQWPSSKLTSKQYWVLPSVFRAVRSDNSFSERKPTVTLGLLANAPYLNDYQAIFLSETEYQDVKVVGLFRDRGYVPVYLQIFSLDYLVVNENAAGGEDASDQSARLATAILWDELEEFEHNFQEIAAFGLPNQDVVHVYRNRTLDLPDSVPPRLLPGSIEKALNVKFGDELLLIGYTIDPPTVADKVVVSLYWFRLQESEEDYSATLKLMNASDQVWGQQQGRPGWDSYPTFQWARGEVVEDIREIPILPGTPPGQYMIELSLYDIRQEKWLAANVPSDLLLGPVDIPRSELAPEDLDMQHRLDADFDAKVRLLGYNIESGFHTGDNVHLTLFWQALQSMDVSYTVFCHLIGPEGQMWAQKDNPPAAGYYPTNTWTEGEIVRDQYDLRIPADAPVGGHSLHIGLYVPDTGERLPVVNPEGERVADHVTISGLEIVR